MNATERKERKARGELVLVERRPRYTADHMAIQFNKHDREILRKAMDIIGGAQYYLPEVEEYETAIVAIDQILEGQD